MKHPIKFYLLILILISGRSYSQDYIYILNDNCTIDLYNKATEHFIESPIQTIKDPRGLILRLENINLDFNNQENLYNIEKFLAKIENPVIIEVHTGNLPENELGNLKKWEFSTIVANKIEAMITKPNGSIDQNRINSVGYGEFLPAKNTPNNGGKLLNRIDIIILCNISGE